MLIIRNNHRRCSDKGWRNQRKGTQCQENRTYEKGSQEHIVIWCWFYDCMYIAMMHIFICTVKHFYWRGLYFRVNSREHRDAKIKSSPIISYATIKEEYMTNRENKVSWINIGCWPRENKVTRIISVLQYVFIQWKNMVNIRNVLTITWENNITFPTLKDILWL